MFDPELPRAARGKPEDRPAGDRRMKVSPLDLRQVKFRKTFRGFDRAEVMALMAEVADDYENALRDVDKLRQEVAKMEALLGHHREHERDLRNTLLTAQKLSDEFRANAEAQARQIIREAEGRSDLLLQKTQARLEDVQREIDGMKLKRREVENSLEASIATLRSTLDFVREQEQREREEKLRLHRPRQAEAPSVPIAPLAAHAPLGSLRPEESKIAASKPAIPTASTG